ncbi:MAG: hypothetical protein LBR50_01210 [Tannerella sp.]|jgi:hypothetical protein|nr:hypothetical protein [Tannerella sp.]
MKTEVIRRLFYLIISAGLLTGCIDDSRQMDDDVLNGAAPQVGTMEFISNTASTVTIKSTVVKANGYAVTEHGFCWGTTPSPTVSDNKLVVGNGGKGDFSETISGLSGNTKYYFRAYAINAKGASYSDEDTLRTSSGLGKVRTLEVANRRATTAMSGGKIELYGEGPVKSYGVFVALSANMSGKDTIVCTNQIVADSFLCNIGGLSHDTHYYVQAYVTNNFGIFTGNIVEFQTGSGTPILDTMEVLDTSIGYEEVTVGSSVLEAGDSKLTESGFCWGENPMPTVESASHLACRYGETGPFVATITGLLSQHIYYVRAYATNDFGTVYSNQIVIQTLNHLPSVRTNTVSVNSAAATVTLSGQITEQGKSPITDKGFCYSATNPMPTSTNGTTVTLTAADPFTTNIVGLKGGTTYYVRAYASNAEGVAYGDVMTFATPQIFTSGLRQFPDDTRLEGSPAYFMIANRFYLLGGDIGPNFTDELWTYNRDEDVWRQLRSFPLGAYKWQATVGSNSGQSVYVLGGVNSANVASMDFYQYVAPNNTWYPMPTGPDAAHSRVGVELAHNVNYIGGIKDTAKNEVWSFSTQTNAWTQQSPFPAKQYGGVAFVIDSTVYAGLGKNTSGVCNKTLWKSDATLASWTYVADNSSINTGVLVSTVLKGKLYIIDEGRRIFEFNPATATWTAKSVLPTSISDIQCMYALDDTIYIGLGNNSLIAYNPLWDN